jgi:regulator of protease activity HflC (stomatin/prohibitin superfamily)
MNSYANRQGELIKQKAKLEAQKLIENAEIDAQITNLKAEKEVNAVEAEIKCCSFYSMTFLLFPV